MSTLGNRIDTLMRQGRLSNQAVADRLGDVTREAVRSWRRGRTEPRIGQLVKLADVLGASVQWLMTYAARRKPRRFSGSG